MDLDKFTLHEDHIDTVYFEAAWNSKLTLQDIDFKTYEESTVRRIDRRLIEEKYGIKPRRYEMIYFLGKEYIYHIRILTDKFSGCTVLDGDIFASIFKYPINLSLVKSDLKSMYMIIKPEILRIIEDGSYDMQIHDEIKDRKLRYLGPFSITHRDFDRTKHFEKLQYALNNFKKENMSIRIYTFDDAVVIDVERELWNK